MRRAAGVVLFSMVSGWAFAAPVVEEFTVVTGGNKVGHLTATRNGAAVAIDYDVKNNGRGPTIAETLTLDQRGLPTQWAISGATTFGSKVDERFALADGKATWTDSVGEGSASVSEPSLYIGQAASPWSLGLYAAALLKDADRSLPALPGGAVRVVPGDSLAVTDGKSVIVLNNLANALLELGDGQEARDYATRAYRLAPDNPSIIDTYAWVVFRTGGDKANAGSLLRKAAEKAPSNQTIKDHLAAVQSATG